MQSGMQETLRPDFISQNWERKKMWRLLPLAKVQCMGKYQATRPVKGDRRLNVESAVCAEDRPSR